MNAGLAVRLVGGFDGPFRTELGSAGVKEASAGAKVDLLFFAVARATQLSQVTELAAGLSPAGALWIVYPKGVPYIREIQVIEAGRAAGLKDIKVASFSQVLTALKFVIPLTKR